LKELQDFEGEMRLLPLDDKQKADVYSLSGTIMYALPLQMTIGVAA
jgi:hypothetical protein